MRKVAGIDVHKAFLEVAYRLNENEISVSRISYTMDGLTRLIKLAKRHMITDVYIESTGNYYYPMYYALKGAGINVHVLNAYKTRRLDPNKTDKRDAIWLLKLGESNLFSGSYIPDDEMLALRFLVREHFRLADRVGDFKRKLHSLLWRLGLYARDIVKNLRSKRKRRLLLAILRGQVDTSKLEDSDIKAIYNVLKRPTMRTYIAVVRIHLESIEFLEKQLENLDALIDCYAKKFEEQIRILMSVPGISKILAVGILAEIGDVSRFPDKNKLASYAGLVPTSRDSGGKRRRGKISKKSNKYLRRYMFLAAMAAMRSKSRRIRLIVERLRGRRKHFKVMVVAVARKLLTIIWFLLTRKDVWREVGYSKRIRSKRYRGKFRIPIRVAIDVLRRAGYEVRKIA